MIQPKTKIIKDNVHGYIKLEDPFWKIINTPEFQRLKWIGQSTINVLFPSAKHDRFTHSIGTYYLGQIAFDGFLVNVQSDISQDTIKNIREWRNSFLLACLLHDIGHVPFSHTCEHLYDHDLLVQELKDAIHNETVKTYITEQEVTSFIKDFDKISSPANSSCPYSPPKNHEILSVIVIISNYKKFCECFECVVNVNNEPYPSLDLVIRSVLGCVYQFRIIQETNDSEAKNIKNCLIQMLNSNTIDVDKLDYINRDSQTSGYDNVLLDNSRLLNSLSFIKNKGYYFPSFNKSALSVVSNVISARNAQLKWVINHPIVIYENFLLEKGIYLAINYIAKTKNQDYEKIIQNIFSPRTISFEGNDIADNYRIKLISDVDIMSLIKLVPIGSQYDRDNTIEQILDRNKWKKPIWKSNAEFVHYVASNTEKMGNNHENDLKIHENIMSALVGLSNIKDGYQDFCQSSVIKPNIVDDKNSSNLNSVDGFLREYAKQCESECGSDNEFIILKGDTSNLNNNNIYKYTYIRFGDKDDYIACSQLNQILAHKPKKNVDSAQDSSSKNKFDHSDSASDFESMNKLFVYIYSKSKINSKMFIKNLVYYFTHDNSLDDFRWPCECID